ncbi:probable receptor-like protein kinase At1g80640 [Lolium perenne]|uniref:probable receptor-like protein kinase At1g80640 n=1 Tax=Lolium perenne TaxID=4522 RepID=UPI0021F5E599|nr:probable receptor-like protein kinase At1g80640 [Lolium perenne]
MGSMRASPLPLLASSIFFFFFLLLPLLCSPVARADGGTTPTVASSPSSAVAAAAAVGDLASSNGGAAVPPAVAPTAPLVEVKRHHLRRELIIAIALASIAGVAIVLAALYAGIVWQRYRRAPDDFKDTQSTDTARIALVPILNNFNSFKSSKKCLVAMMEYTSLEKATGNFSDTNVLGVGGFGCVYKANFDGGFVAAVKRLGGEDQEYEKEFENELDLLQRIRHSNIVSLVGFCIHEDYRFIVYELMENGSLETQLHGPSHGSALSWHIRMKIALDTARGLEYLHEHCSPPIIHRDLKSSNILLDSDFNAKISDFGLAVSSGNRSKGNLKLSGTLGYVAPEYLLDGKLTEKSDVYAFGVVLLELLLGRRPIEKMAPSQCQSIVTWAMPQLIDRSKLPTIIDPVIKNTMDLKHLYQVAAVAVLCVQPEPSYRPLITDVLHSLIPLVPMELGGTLRATLESPRVSQHRSPC